MVRPALDPKIDQKLPKHDAFYKIQTLNEQKVVELRVFKVGPKAALMDPLISLFCLIFLFLCLSYFIYLLFIIFKSVFSFPIFSSALTSYFLFFLLSSSVCSYSSSITRMFPMQMAFADEPKIV